MEETLCCQWRAKPRILPGTAGDVGDFVGVYTRE